MKQLVLKSTGVPVSVLGSIAKSPDVHHYTKRINMLTGKLVDEPVEVTPKHVRVIIHHPTHNEVAVVKRSSIHEVEVKV